MHSRIATLLKQSTQTLKKRQTELVTGLFKYTSRQPDGGIDLNIAPHSAGIQNLLRAVQNNDPYASVFADDQCYRYLLYCLKHEKIEFWQGMTLYSYLMALMQFTPKQPLHLYDSMLKEEELTHAGVDIAFLTKNTVLTPKGKAYLEAIIANCAALGIKIDADRFCRFAKTLAPVNNWLIKTNFDNQIRPYRQNYNHFTHIIVENTPLSLIETQKQINHFYTPSFAIMQHLLRQLSPQPVAMQPVIGQIDSAEFLTLHQNNCHPIALYDPQSDNNLTHPHGIAVGPFSTFLHDYSGHTVWGSLLTPRERQHIHADFIPVCNTILQTLETYSIASDAFIIDPPKSLKARLQHAIINANDFDLTWLDQFNDPTQRFYKYLARTFADDRYQFLYPAKRLNDNCYNGCVTLKIGSCQEDHLYFLLKKTLYQMPPNPFWQAFLPYLESHITSDCQDPLVIQALDVLAQIAAGVEITKPPTHIAIDWQAWQALLERRPHPTDFWAAAKRERHPELLALICDYRLAVFPPSMPADHDKMNDLQKLVTKQLMLWNLNRQASSEADNRSPRI